MKYAALIFFALCIDGLQALLGFGFVSLGTAIPVVGNGIGFALGFAIDMCISLTFGTILILTLLYLGMYYPSRLGGGVLFELVPGLDALPGWTVMTLTCVLRKIQEEGGALGSVSGIFMGALSAKTVTGKVFAGIQSIQIQRVPQRQNELQNQDMVDDSEVASSQMVSRQMTKVDLKNIDGISLKGKTSPGVKAQPTYAV